MSVGPGTGAEDCLPGFTTAVLAPLVKLSGTTT